MGYGCAADGTWIFRGWYFGRSVVRGVRGSVSMRDHNRYMRSEYKVVMECIRGCIARHNVEQLRYFIEIASNRFGVRRCMECLKSSSGRRPFRVIRISLSVSIDYIDVFPRRRMAPDPSQLVRDNIIEFIADERSIQRIQRSSKCAT